MSRGQSAHRVLVHRGCWLIAALTLTAGSASASVVSFQGLGTTARPNATSADGTVVVGDGFVWHAGSGLSALPFSRANGISADGSIVVGRNGSRAVRWDGMIVRDLDTFGWGEYSTANAVSSDGSVVVGNGATNSDFSETRGFRWTPEHGTEACGSGITGGVYENWGAMAASADGSVVVGNQGYTPRAYRWTSATGPVELFPDMPYSTATGVSADGLVVAATVAPDAPSIRHAARVVFGSGAQLLGELSGGEFSKANGISADGLWLVGLSDSLDGNRAFLWNSLGGTRSVSDFLTAAGTLTHQGWTLSEATAISGDGRTIVGVGINPIGDQESWIATIPAPASLAPLVGLSLITTRRRRA